MKTPWVGGLVTVAILAAPANAAPFLVPSLSTAILTDDNVLVSAEDRRDDVITRVSPSVEVGVDSERLWWNASYSQDMENYKNNPDLDSTDMRRYAENEFLYRLNELILLSLDASYTESQFPSELNITTGAGEGRIEGERTDINPGINYRFNERSTGQIDLRNTRESLASGIENDTKAVNIEYEHALTANTQMTYGYTYSHYTFDNPETNVVNLTEHVHAPRVGVFHNFSAQTSLSVQVGPSFATDDVGANFAVQLLRNYARGQFQIGYNRSAGSLIGEAGLVELDALNATATHRFGNDFEMSAGLSYGKVHRDDSDFSDDRVSRAMLSAIYHVNKYMSLTASYSFSEQRISLPAGNAKIPRGVAMLALTFTYPRRPSPVIFNR